MQAMPIQFKATGPKFLQQQSDESATMPTECRVPSEYQTFQRKLRSKVQPSIPFTVTHLSMLQCHGKSPKPHPPHARPSFSSQSGSILFSIGSKYCNLKTDGFGDDKADETCDTSLRSCTRYLWYLSIWKSLALVATTRRS
jgi:hypothetical protein